jgi:exonuclease III
MDNSFSSGSSHQTNGSPFSQRDVVETVRNLRRARLPHQILGANDVLRLGVWNVCSVARRARGEVMVDDLEKYGVDVACLTESHMPGEGGPVRFVGSNGVRQMYFTAQSEGVGGVGLALTDRAERALVQEPKYVNHRLKSATFQQQIGMLTVIICYAPTNPSSEVVKDEFYDQLDSLISSVPNNHYLVVAGDLNAEVGSNRRGWERVLGNFGRGTINDNGTRMLSLASYHGLKAMNTYFQHKAVHSVTWNSNAGNAAKMLDYVLVRGRFFTSVHDVRVRRGTALPTDHELVVVTLKLHLLARPKKRFKQRKFDVQRLGDHAVRQDFLAKLQPKLPQPTELPLDVDDSWKRVHDALNDAGAEAVGYFKPTKKQRIISACTVELSARKRAASSVVERRATGKLLRRSLDRDERAYWRSIAAEMEETHLAGNSKILFKVLKRVMGRVGGVSETILDNNGETIKDGSKRMERWVDHFRSLLNKEPPAALDPDLVEAADGATVDDAIESAPPTDQEIRKAIESLKAGKAAGPDGVPPEFYKIGKEELVPVIREILKKVWEAKRAPKGWQIGDLRPVFKKGDARCCANYRGIMLLPIIGKIVSLIILRRICGVLDSRCQESQSGFRQGRGTVDNIFNLRQILERRHKWSQETLVAFLDYSAAFDSVDRASLWLLLKVAGVPEGLVCLIRQMYDDSQCTVGVYGESSLPFDVKTGVRQGDVLSPLLFLQAVDWIMCRATLDTDGVSAGVDVRVSHLEYADDVAVLASSLHVLQAHVDRIKDRSELLGLKLNAKKCEYIASHRVDGDLLLNGLALKRVPHFCYLGSVIDPKGDPSAEIASRVGKATGVFKSLETKLWGRREIVAKLKIRLYDSLILAVLLYGVEATPLRDRDVDALAVFENRCLRKIFGIHWEDDVSSEQLLRRAGRVDGNAVIQPLGQRLRNFRLRWLGHLSRMRGDRLPRVIFYAAPLELKQWERFRIDNGWKRRPGGQCTTWQDLVESDLRSFIRIYQHGNFKWAQAVISLSENRAGWRQIVRDLKWPVA